MPRCVELPRTLLQRTLAAGVVVFLTSGATPASAQMVCMESNAIYKRLQNGYGESRTAAGKAHSNAIIEIWSSADGTFTVVVTRPDGVSCLMAVGTEFTFVKDDQKSAGFDL